MASYSELDDEDPPCLANDNRTIFITRQIRYFVDDYIKCESLGEPGSFGTAYKCYRKTDIDRLKPFAVKEINKSRFTMSNPRDKDSLLSTLQNEIAILLKVRHRNIVELYDVYESRDQLHLVMEYLDGGELFDRICCISHYGEKQAANIIIQILDALNVVHNKKILHLDLKPENILFKDNSDNQVKLIDFGMARIVPKLTQLKGKIGTIQYMAPEVISGNLFSFGADVWSVGIILYCMLFGYPPFFDDDDEGIGDMVECEKRIENKICNGFEGDVKDGYGAWFPSDIPISDECMKLISNMLEKDVTKRWTVKECLSCKWLQSEYEYNDNNISPLFRESLLKYNKTNKFRVAISNLFSNYLDIDIKQEIIKHFNEMDTNKDGKLSLKEFEDGLKKLNKEINAEEIELIFKNLDFNNDLTISLNELITSTNITSLVGRDERLYAAFERLDVNHDGRIDKNEMVLVAKEILNDNINDDIKINDNDDNEEILTLKRLQSAFDEADTNHDGTVDYDEFLHVLHPEFKENESFESISKQKSVENSFNAAQFNVTNKTAKGLIFQPKGYNDNDININNINKSNNINDHVETLKFKLKLKTEELNDAKIIYEKNITKVLNLQNELKKKNITINSLNNQLNKRNDEIKKMRELLKSIQLQQ